MNEKPLISFDYAIKYLLKNKGDYDVIEGFISALLQAEGYGPVKITALLDAESNKEEEHLRQSIADLVVQDVKGIKYIVEIERAYTSTFIHKACFNSCRLIVDSIARAEDYATIKKVFHITLLYFTTSEIKNAMYHGKTIFKEVDTHKQINLHLASLGGQIYDLNILPEYFLISVPLFDNVVKRELDEWLYVLKNSDTKKDFKSPYMDKVRERLSILKMTAAEKDAYYMYLKNIYTHRDALSAAAEKAKAETKIEVARAMLLENLDIKLISKLTGLTVQEIEDLIPK